MKKTMILLTLLILFSLAISACGGSNSSGNTASAEVSGTPMPGGELSDNIKLLLGILSLADSDTPLTVEQATAMLPLWKAVRSLGESDTTAQAEIDALYTQIRGTLTDEQLAAIEAMALNAESMATLADELGISMGFQGGRGTLSAEMQATMEALRASGQMPQFDENFTPPEGAAVPEDMPRIEIQGGGEAPSGGVVIQGGSGMGGGGEMQVYGDSTGISPEQMATAQASGVNPPALRNTISGAWLDALITMLEGMVAGS
jgi:hypothetical protein